MSTKPDLENRLSELARTDAIESSTFPLRIADALRLMDDYTSPLRPATGNGTGDYDGEPRTADRARTDRNELIRLILSKAKCTTGIARILNDWAPLAPPPKAGDTENATIWCQNCTKYGKAEPRRGDGSKLCRWCGDVNRAYGKLPNEALQLLRTRHPRISDNEYRRILGVTAKQAKKGKR